MEELNKCINVAARVLVNDWLNGDDSLALIIFNNPPAPLPPNTEQHQLNNTLIWAVCCCR